MPPIVLVTEPEFRRAEAVFRAASGVNCVAAPPAEEALAAAIQKTGARAAVVGGLAYRHSLYSALPRGGVLARLGVGYDGIDTARATGAGLLCTNTPGVLEHSVAEHTMLLVLAAARHLTAMTSRMREHHWMPREGVELRGQTLAIIGCGQIGRVVARIASAGFGMRVIGFRRAPSGNAQAAPVADFETMTSDFAAAVRNADYVSLHIPASPETAHFIDRERLSLLQKHAWLVNTARGAVVDERALYDALLGGRIGGAALDVFEREPYEPIDASRDLRTLANVMLTPHAASNTTAANRRMAERALRNIALAHAGEFARMDLINPEVLA